MLICSVVAAALTACGGGGGGGVSASAAADATAAALSPTPSDSAASSAATSGDATTTSPVDVSGNDVTVLADAGSTATAALAVSAKATTVAVPIAAENDAFKVSNTMTVRFGAGNAWVTKSVTDAGTCSVAFFGTDPSPGVAKTCQVLVASTAATGAAVATESLPEIEGATFYVFGTRSVQFGADGKYVTKTVTGRGTCSIAFFGSDPSYGVLKTCQPAPLATKTATTTMSLMPAVDMSKLPASAAGYAGPRVAAANVADPSQNPTPSDIGDFREYCEFSHMSMDDPIVAPGGVSSHLHVFMGNTGTNANSTASSIANSGNSTCAGGTLNRSSYWFPAVIDTTDGTPQKPLGSLIYYKQNYNYVSAASIRPFPAGLRMVAGSAASTGIQDGIVSFTCTRADGSYNTHKAIPTDCLAGSTLTIGVGFPQCWDGVNLDSPDHKSHMAYPGIGCPASHPVPVTGITFEINYKVGANGTSHWRLSSDSYDPGFPGGYSSHADWFGGWDPTIMNTWTTRCINASMDCHAFLIGDGRILY